MSPLTKKARKVATDFILPIWLEIDPTGKNQRMLKEALEALTDEQFVNLVTEIENDTAYLSIWMDNLTGTGISVENNYRVAKKYGVEFFHRIRETDESTGLVVTSNVPYFCAHFLKRRQIQTLESKISLPDDQKHIDELTDQPTGVSKGSSMSGPEFEIVSGQEGYMNLIEFTGPRGGDREALAALERSMHETGKASLSAISAYAVGAKSVYTLSTLLAGMHFDNNLARAK